MTAVDLNNAERKADKNKEKSDNKLYTKEKLIASKDFKKFADALSFCLTDGKMYTKDEAEKLLNNFMKGKVL